MGQSVQISGYCSPCVVERENLRDLLVDQFRRVPLRKSNYYFYSIISSNSDDALFAVNWK